jgi:hypothetical protein
MAEPLADVIAPSPRNNTSDKTPGPNLSIIIERHHRHNPTKVLAATAIVPGWMNVKRVINHGIDPGILAHGDRR